MTAATGTPLTGAVSPNSKSPWQVKVGRYVFTAWNDTGCMGSEDVLQLGSAIEARNPLMCHINILYIYKHV